MASREFIAIYTKEAGSSKPRCSKNRLCLDDSRDALLPNTTPKFTELRISHLSKFANPQPYLADSGSENPSGQIRCERNAGTLLGSLRHHAVRLHRNAWRWDTSAFLIAPVLDVEIVLLGVAILSIRL